MLKHLYIEQIIETLDKIIEDTEDREDREDFNGITQQLVEVREDLHELEEEDG